jgi:hypothetical protein
MVLTSVLCRKHTENPFVNAFNYIPNMKPFTNGIIWLLLTVLKLFFQITGACEWYCTPFCVESIQKIHL